MAYLTIDEIIEKSSSISVRKSKNGSITISFSTFDTNLIHRIKSSAVDGITVNIRGITNKYRLRGYSHTNHIYNFNLEYSAFKDMQITRTIIFNTVNENVMNVYESMFNINPFLSSYEDANVDIRIKRVRNLWGIDGWSVNDILSVVTKLLDHPIERINIPSAFNYRLKYYRIAEGSNLYSILSGLFKSTAIGIYTLGDQIYIRNMINVSPLDINSFGKVCDNIEVVETVTLDHVIVNGDRSEPKYIHGVGGKELETTYNELDRKVLLNLIGREFVTTEQTTVAVHHVEAFKIH